MGYLAAARLSSEWLSFVRGDLFDEILATLLQSHYMALLEGSRASGSSSSSPSFPMSSLQPSDGKLEAAIAALSREAASAAVEEEEGEAVEEGVDCEETIAAFCGRLREAIQKLGLATPADVAKTPESVLFPALAATGLDSPTADSPLWVREWDVACIRAAASAHMALSGNEWMHLVVSA